MEHFIHKQKATKANENTTSWRFNFFSKKTVPDLAIKLQSLNVE